MLRALEGSQAIARAVALARAEVVAAYPITPQTHIVEHIAKLIADGQFECEMVSVESEHSAGSVVLGAAAAGSRAYTATASQGILLMAEVIYNIAGLRVPLVMTCANRALSGPISIWNDHQDSMAVRDAGWIQLYCADNQDAVDTTIQAFRIAERTELPVMVCVDGFTLTHTLEALDMPERDQVDAFLPAYRFSRNLDPQSPRTVGTLLPPEYFAELRHAHHRAMLRAEEEIVRAAEEWSAVVSRPTKGLLEVTGDAHASVGILTLGSVTGTLQDAMDDEEALPARLIQLRAFRPFPVGALQEACAGLTDLVVLERALSPGAGAIVGAEARAALSELREGPRVHAYAVGLGGRDVPLDLYRRVMAALDTRHPERFAVFDADLAKLPENDR